MKTLRILLLALVALAVPHCLHAQTTESFTFTTNSLVPDGSFSGLSDVRTVNSAITNISSLAVRLKIAGEFNGDMYAYLRHGNGFVVLLNRAGKTAANAHGYGDNGFNVVFQAGVTNSDIHLYQNVLTPASGSPLTGYWQPDGRNVDPTNVLDTTARGTSLTNFTGLNGSGQWTLYLVDAESGGTNLLAGWGLDISGAATPTLTWTNPANITYGTALSPAQLNATASYNSTNISGTFTYSIPAGTVLAAGSSRVISVTFTPADTNGFASVTANVSLNVLPAPLVVTAVSTNTIYGAALPALAASYSGFVNNDSISSLTSPAIVATSASSTSPVGAYSLVPSGVVSSNYTATYVNGTLTVAPAALVVTAGNSSKVYGASLPTFTAGYVGFVNGDSTASLGNQATLSTTATQSSGVGNYSIIPSGVTATNYIISYVNGTLSVTSATITITANDQTKAFGAALPALTAGYSGFVLGQGTNSLTALATVVTTATAASNAGSYPIRRNPVALLPVPPTRCCRART